MPRSRAFCDRAGQIEADRLTARDVTCRIRGVGVIGCHATQKLTAKATGNGEVYYRGTPEIKKLSLGELSVPFVGGEISCEGFICIGRDRFLPV